MKSTNSSVNKVSTSKEDIKSTNKSNVHSTNKLSIQNNSSGGNIKDLLKKHINHENNTIKINKVNNIPLEINLTNNLLYDIEEGDEDSFKNNNHYHKTNLNDKMDIEESIKETKNNKIQKVQKETKKKDIEHNKRKNDKSFNKIAKSENSLVSENKKIKVDENYSNNEINSFDKEDIEMLQSNSNNSYNEKSIIEKKEPKKIKKTRKVKITKTYVDEDGFDVTNDVLEDEEYWTDEKSEASSIGINLKNNLNLNKTSAPSIAKKQTVNTKKGNTGQKSLESFFKK